MARKDGDGKFYMSFVQMGHGDCTLIRCPNGRTVMVDCGSDRYDYDGHLAVMRDTVFSTKYLLNYDRLDALILTHPDTDHHNKITPLLGDRGKKKREEWPLEIAIDKLYYSGALNDYSDSFTAFALSSTIHPTDIKSITYNVAGDPRIETWASAEWEIPALPSKPDYPNAEYLDGNGFVRVIDGTKSRDFPVYISILASNVVEYPKQDLIDDGYLEEDDEDPSSPVNTASIVTLVEVGNFKVLLLGDATKHTEKFLLDQHGNKLKNVALVRVGHHGSSKTSSSPKFVNKVAPLRAIVSAARRESSHKLPRSSVLKRFWDGARLLGGQTEHDSYYWRHYLNDSVGGDIQGEPVGLFYYVKKSTTTALEITGSDGTIAFQEPQD